MDISLNIACGLAIGAYGTLVGAGGGFLLVPLFLLVYHLPHGMAVGTSLAIVTANAVSGSLGYIRARRVDYRSGVLFALCSFPGAYFGALATDLVSGKVFDRIFGLFLIGIAVYLFFRKRPHDSAPGGPSFWPGAKERRLLTRDGEILHYQVHEVAGGAVSVAVGAISSWLGIGGGILHVPLMSEFLRIPVHVAVATSHFVLAWTALVGAVLHAQQGNLDIRLALTIGVGAVLGAQLGVRLARIVHGNLVLRFLSLALLLVGLRLLF